MPTFWLENNQYHEDNDVTNNILLNNNRKRTLETSIMFVKHRKVNQHIFHANTISMYQNIS